MHMKKIFSIFVIIFLGFLFFQSSPEAFGGDMSVGLKVHKALVISGIEVVNILEDSATANWSTAGSYSKCVFSFGKTAACELGNFSEALAAESHSAQMINLDPDTLYYYKINCTTEDGKQNKTTEVMSFTTLAASEDDDNDDQGKDEDNKKEEVIFVAPADGGTNSEEVKSSEEVTSSDSEASSVKTEDRSSEPVKTQEQKTSSMKRDIKKEISNLPIVKDFVEFAATPEGQTMVVASEALGMVSVAAAVATSSSSLMSLPNFFQALNFLGFGIFNRKKRKEWGVVYDSQTKVPIPLALVEIADKFGRVLDKSVTDKDGRYGFFVPAGEYYIRVTRNDFRFPSDDVTGIDPLYGSVYNGGLVGIKEEDIVKFDIPIDPININLREIAEKKINYLYAWRGKIGMFLIEAIFYFGLVFTIFNQVYFPSALNMIFLFIYLIISVASLMMKTKKLGILMDVHGGKPIPFATIRVFEKKGGLKTRKGFVVTDMLGRYYQLIQNGEYDLQISGETLDKRNVSSEKGVDINDQILNEKIEME